MKRVLHVGVAGDNSPAAGIVNKLGDFCRFFQVVDTLDPTQRDIADADIVLFDWQRFHTMQELSLADRIVAIYGVAEPYVRLRELLSAVAPHEVAGHTSRPCIITGEHYGFFASWLIGNHIVEALMLRCYTREAPKLRYEQP